MGIGGLSTEILDKILSNSIHTTLYFHPTIGSLDLMGVCRRWHHIITSTPKFWTNVWVIVNYPQPAPFELILWRLARRLARCERELVDVTWKVRQFEPQTRRLMDTIGEYTPFDRLRSLYVVHHDGGVPDIGTSLSPLGTFRSLETLRIQKCPRGWFVDYINSTLSPSAPLRKLQCYSFGNLLHDHPGELSNILHAINKLHASRILTMSSPTSGWNGLPTNITDLTVEHFQYTGKFDFSHVEIMYIRDTVGVEEVALHAFTALTTLDIMFDDGFSVRRLTFSALLELRIRGNHYHTLSNIDAPRLEVLVTGGGYPWTPRRARSSLEHTVKLREYALQPTRELEIGVAVSTQTLQTLLDRSPALEKLTLHMTRDACDREVLRLLLFPSASPEDKDSGDESEGENEAEWETQRHHVLQSDKGDIVEKPRGQNLCSLTILLDNILTDEDLAIWEKCLRGFEDVVKGGKGGGSNTQFKCLQRGP